MVKKLRNITVFLLLLFCTGCAGRYFHAVLLPAPVPPVHSLENLSFCESWEGIFLKGKKIGFSHLVIEKKGGSCRHFLIRSQSVIRVRVLGIGKEITAQDNAEVMPDLKLVSFQSKLIIDKKSITYNGKVTDGMLSVVRQTENKHEKKTFPLKGVLYPSSAVSFYPVLKGMDIGKEYSYNIYDIETDSIKTVKQKIVACQESELFDGYAFKVKTSFKGQDIDIWISPKGETVLSMAMYGMLLWAKESPYTAKKFIADKSFGKSDLLLDFSLVKADKRIPSPRTTASLVVEITGMTDELVISDFWQNARVKANGESSQVLYTIPSDIKRQSSLSEPMQRFYLTNTFFVENNNPEIIRQARQIVPGKASKRDAVVELVHWVSSEIADDFSESFSSVEVLKSKKGECQAHSYLYAAFARALNIPTRLVSGLVYVKDLGFLYHTWAESYIEGGWISVDPTFGQVPSDATHIKLVEGEQFSDFSKIVKVVGRLKAKIVSFE